MTVYTDSKMRFSFPGYIEGVRLSIVFTQNGHRVLEFRDGDQAVKVAGAELILSMTPEDTGKFKPDPDSYAVAQINMVKNGRRCASCPIRIPVRPNLKAEVMV